LAANMAQGLRLCNADRAGKSAQPSGLCLAKKVKLTLNNVSVLDMFVFSC
jgi:hypothetical protein